MRMLCKPLYALQAVTEAGERLSRVLGKGGLLRSKVGVALYLISPKPEASSLFALMILRRRRTNQEAEHLRKVIAFYGSGHAGTWGLEGLLNEPLNSKP